MLGEVQPFVEVQQIHWLTIFFNNCGNLGQFIWGLGECFPTEGILAGGSPSF